GRPPNLGVDIKMRRFIDDRERLFALATTVPALSQVPKAQSVVKTLNGEIGEFLNTIEPSADPDRLTATVEALAGRADALLRTVEGTPLYEEVRREVDQRVGLARALAGRVG